MKDYIFYIWPQEFFKLFFLRSINSPQQRVIQLVRHFFNTMYIVGTCALSRAAYRRDVFLSFHFFLFFFFPLSFSPSLTTDATDNCRFLQFPILITKINRFNYRLQILLLNYLSKGYLSTGLIIGY